MLETSEIGSRQLQLEPRVGELTWSTGDCNRWLNHVFDEPLRRCHQRLSLSGGDPSLCRLTTSRQNCIVCRTLSGLRPSLPRKCLNFEPYPSAIGQGEAIRRGHQEACYAARLAAYADRCRVPVQEGPAFHPRAHVPVAEKLFDRPDIGCLCFARRDGEVPSSESMVTKRSKLDFASKRPRIGQVQGTGGMAWPRPGPFLPSGVCHGRECGSRPNPGRDG